MEPPPSAAPTPGPAPAPATAKAAAVEAAPPAQAGVASHHQWQTDVELTRYWTPERLAGALDADVLRRTAPGAPSAAAPAPEPPLPAPAAPGRTPLAGNPVQPYDGGGLASRVNGALFSTIKGVDLACSGAVVDSPNGNLVVTAGHCLRNGGAGGSFASNIVFIPGYANGAAPYGIWHAQWLTVTTGWGNREDFDEDAGFATFRPLGGRTLRDTVGGAFPIGFDLAPQPQTVFGYPKLPPFNGTTLMTCAGTPTADPLGGSSLGLPCAMTAGASGGVWLAGLQGGTGVVDSVVSYSYMVDPNVIYGTRFGPKIRALYQHAIGT
ncbi:signal peptide-containing protein [Frankia sp. CNm7]|uniref:Signal peptide-containing protein n=2 Tax=Frankia nepalensis TaxID=1836974 RepID=A0A937UMW9_9ACTN|nr:signal peptide-containing protein [Frankia nepalensis]MBL7510456.1 signal peptide-containing protein [Frankia nepalensis]MBL7517204.1 signal peptide-containing protein [Frankia nepalensis]MBL7625650.1 signal peptide-containing protein [Frankia nepalensis]